MVQNSFARISHVILVNHMKKNKPTQNFTQFDHESQRLICQGKWDLDNFKNLRFELNRISLPANGEVIIGGEAITKMDSAGAWLLGRWLKRISDTGLKIQLQDFSEQYQKLLSIVESKIVPQEDVPKFKSPGWLVRFGQSVLQQLIELRDFLAFTGKLSTEAVRVITHPRHLRWNSLMSVIETTGFQALPIIALLSFMIGVVIAYQMGVQLRTYGANIFIVDLLGHSILREFGPLITAIMVAGRTGSAFTAQLGIMKINQEIDALDTMGVTPAELLLLPRIAGLFIVLPLLTIWADIFGVIGGMLMAKSMLGVNLIDFLQRFEHQIPLRALMIGLGKAPVFALLIASIGCFQGIQVQGSADSVGKLTTRSVVLAIFFIIVTDAIFSVIFSKLKL